MEVVIDVDTSRAVHEVSPGFLGVNIDMLALSTYAAGQLRAGAEPRGLRGECRAINVSEACEILCVCEVNPDGDRLGNSSSNRPMVADSLLPHSPTKTTRVACFHASVGVNGFTLGRRAECDCPSWRFT